MKPIYYSTLIFILFTVSHAFRFETTPDNHNHDDNLIKSNGGDSLIRLPTETSPVSHLTQSSHTKLPHVKTTSFTSRIIGLGFMVNRRPVQLPHRSWTRHRCRHRFSKFGPRHPEDMRHVAGKHFDWTGKTEVKGELESDSKGYRHHLRHHRRHHDHDHHMHYDHDHVEEEENGVMNKILKFLSHF